MESEIIRNWLRCYGRGSGSGKGRGEGADIGDGYGIGDKILPDEGGDEGDGWGRGKGVGAGYKEGDGRSSNFDSLFSGGLDEEDGLGLGEAVGRGTKNEEGFGTDLDFYTAFISGSDIKLFNGSPVVGICIEPMIIVSIHGNYAKGKKISEDLSETEDCFIAKTDDSRFFASGKTLHEAKNNLLKKVQEFSS